jgi:hypothetical protein
MATKKKVKKEAAPPPPAEWPFGTKNYILFGISLVIIIVGYICLGYGDDPNAPITLTIAPILLVIGYALIPFAIMARDKGKEAGAETEPEAGESE